MLCSCHSLNRRCMPPVYSLLSSSLMLCLFFPMFVVLRLTVVHVKVGPHGCLSRNVHSNTSKTVPEGVHGMMLTSAAV
jgi:hypothetical protein